MKKLIIINGAPGIGKSATSQLLYQQLNNSAWLDGDWCWMINPFKVTDENKQMVEDNINHLLSNYINNSTIEYIILCWVIPHQSLLNSLLEKLPIKNFQIYKITLTAQADIFRNRLLKDKRTDDQIFDSIKRLEAYHNMDTIKIDTSDLSIQETVTRIREIIK